MTGERRLERAFSRHKRVHNRLRANLSSESLNNQLFLKYNFAPDLKIACEPGNINLEEEKTSSCYNIEYDSDSSVIDLDNGNDN